MSAYYAFPTFREGQTWKGVPSIRVQKNGANPASSLASAKLIFKKKSSQLPGLTLTTETGGGMEIVDADAWDLTIPEQNLALSQGVWDATLVYTTVDGVVRDYVAGTITVKERV